jgi:Protein of unknown function (DUF3124)
MVWLARLALCWLLAAGPAFGQAAPARMTGQSLYLPVYSHIQHGEAGGKGDSAKMLVSVMVSIRNTDTVRPMRVTSAVYFDTDGKRIKEYVTAPRTVAPMGTLEIFIPRSDDKGGSGANFVIAWKSDAPVNPPLVEALHANLPAGRSIVFVTGARPILVD